MQNAFNTCRTVSGISHPLVADMYVKSGFGSDHQDVLVIETYKHETKDSEADRDAFDPYLADLLVDLESLKNQVESKFGHLDRVDIRSS